MLTVSVRWDQFWLHQRNSGQTQSAYDSIDPAINLNLATGQLLSGTLLADCFWLSSGWRRTLSLSSSLSVCLLYLSHSCISALSKAVHFHSRSLFRPALEPSDEAMLSDYEARRLLNAFIKEFVQMTAEDLDQQEPEENRYMLFWLKEIQNQDNSFTDYLKDGAFIFSFLKKWI